MRHNKLILCSQKLPLRHKRNGAWKDFDPLCLSAAVVVVVVSAAFCFPQPPAEDSLSCVPSWSGFFRGKKRKDVVFCWLAALLVESEGTCAAHLLQLTTAFNMMGCLSVGAQCKQTNILSGDKH